MSKLLAVFIASLFVTGAFAQTAAPAVAPTQTTAPVAVAPATTAPVAEKNGMKPVQTATTKADRVAAKKAKAKARAAKKKKMAKKPAAMSQ